MGFTTVKIYPENPKKEKHIKKDISSSVPVSISPLLLTLPPEVPFQQPTHTCLPPCGNLISSREFLEGINKFIRES